MDLYPSSSVSVYLLLYICEPSPVPADRVWQCLTEQLVLSCLALCWTATLIRCCCVVCCDLLLFMHYINPHGSGWSYPCICFHHSFSAVWDTQRRNLASAMRRSFSGEYLDVWADSNSFTVLLILSLSSLSTPKPSVSAFKWGQGSPCSWTASSALSD